MSPTLLNQMKAVAKIENARARATWGGANFNYNPPDIRTPIIDALKANGPMSARELAEYLRESQQTISNRIKKIKDTAGLNVEMQRVDYHNFPVAFYSVADDG